jgi:hypothetical protein
MPKLTDTHTIILSAGTQRPDNIAMPLPKRLHGAAVKMVVGKMIACGWLEEVDAHTRQGETLWRETGVGHGITLVVTDAGLLAIGIELVMMQTIAPISKHASDEPAPKHPTPRTGTKQAMLIAMLQRPEGDADVAQPGAAEQQVADNLIISIDRAGAGRGLGGVERQGGKILAVEGDLGQLGRGAWRAEVELEAENLGQFDQRR